MKDYNYVAKNQSILNEWFEKFVADKKNDEKYKECDNFKDYFAPDGIMNKGDFFIDIDNDEAVRRKESGKENELWSDCPLRVLFLTKDEHANVAWDVHTETFHEKAWDVRTETFYEKGYGVPPHNKTVSGSFFYQNEACLLYGLLNTKPTEDGMMKYNAFSWEKALEFSDETIFARINCKKEIGGATISNNLLKDAINKYYKYLKEQILNLDADILVCCGSNNQNIILDTVYSIYKDEFEYVDCVEGQGSGMHYNAKRKKLAIDAYHLAHSRPKCKGSDALEERYYETIEMYHKFLKYLKEGKFKGKAIDFSASHR